MCLWKSDLCHEEVSDVLLHGPCCIIFLVLGTVQVSSGIYYYLSVPVFKLLFNAFIGFTSLIIGTVGLIVLCVCLSSVRKYELILYCSTGIIFLNAINLALLEFGQLKDVFSEQYRQRIKDSTFDLLSTGNGRMLTSVTALISVLVGFVESQFTFCCLNRVQYLVFEQRLVKADANPETSADLEYVIDKKKLVNIPRGSSYSIAEEAALEKEQGTLGRRRRRKSKTGTLTRQHKHQYLQQQEAANEVAERSDNTKIEVYTQSWVFKENAHSGHPGSFSSVSSASPELSPKAQPTRRTHQREVSEISHTPSDRQAMQMTSFSRSTTPIPSPVPPEYESSSTFIGQRRHSRSNSDYLSVATTPKHYENTLTMTLRSPKRNAAFLQQPNNIHSPQSSAIHHLPQPVRASAIMSTDPTSEAVHRRSTFASSARTDPSYASLISELEESLSSKLQSRGQPSHNQSNYQSSTVSNVEKSTLINNSVSTDTLASKSSKEGEFSKELELALQLIKELETPSECNPMNPKLFSLDGSHTDLARAGSDKTLSAVSLEEFTSPIKGKMDTIV